MSIPTIDVVKAYQNHKELVDAYLSGERTEMMNDTQIMGFSVAAFSTILITLLVIWVTALYMIISEWDAVPVWVRVISLIDIVFGGGFFAILLILITKRSRKTM